MNWPRWRPRMPDRSEGSAAAAAAAALPYRACWSGAAFCTNLLPPLFPVRLAPAPPTATNLGARATTRMGLIDTWSGRRRRCASCSRGRRLSLLALISDRRPATGVRPAGRPGRVLAINFGARSRKLGDFSLCAARRSRNVCRPNCRL